MYSSQYISDHYLLHSPPTLILLSAQLGTFCSTCTTPSSNNGASSQKNIRSYTAGPAEGLAHGHSHSHHNLICMHYLSNLYNLSWAPHVPELTGSIRMSTSYRMIRQINLKFTSALTLSRSGKGTALGRRCRGRLFPLAPKCRDLN